MRVIAIPFSVGPVYFDYIRLLPKDDPAADERLFLARVM